MRRKIWAPHQIPLTYANTFSMRIFHPHLSKKKLSSKTRKKKNGFYVNCFKMDQWHCQIGCVQLLQFFALCAGGNRLQFTLYIIFCRQCINFNLQYVFAKMFNELVHGTTKYIFDRIFFYRDLSNGMLMLFKWKKSAFFTLISNYNWF